MPRYSHQIAVAFTVESDIANIADIPLDTLVAQLALRMADIAEHDGHEAFGLLGTYDNVEGRGYGPEGVSSSHEQAKS